MSMGHRSSGLLWSGEDVIWGGAPTSWVVIPFLDVWIGEVQRAAVRSGGEALMLESISFTAAQNRQSPFPAQRKNLGSLSGQHRRLDFGSARR